MKTRPTAAAAVAALLMGAPAIAQQRPMQHQQPMQHAQMQAMGGMSCMDMMGGPPPGMILQHGKALGLSAQQVERLEALKKQDSTAAMPHMREAMAAHQAAAQILKAEHPDFAAYETKLGEAAHHAIAGHVAMARSAVDARDVLTAAQRTRLQTEMKSGAGMMGQMQGMGGMMGGAGGMDCMSMMGGMHGSGSAAPAAKHPNQH